MESRIFGKRAYIIAEAGVNHNGDVNLAYKLIDIAKEAGADAVKFQTGKAELLVSKFAQKAEYQKTTTDKNESQLDMIKKLFLNYSHFEELKKYCEKIGIDFISTPFDLDSIDFLDSIDVPIWKVPSGEITNLPYLIKIASTKKPIIMSTGMSETYEIREAISALREKGSGEIIILQCNTEYPTPYEDINLRVMKTLNEEFGLPVGLSDHSLGIEVSLAAVALGAVIIEKHFTISRDMEGPDHKASLEPDELKQMVKSIRNVEMAMGISSKGCTNSERKNKYISRKSIVAKKDIKKGDILTEDNLTVKRPGNGVSPMKWFEVLGNTATRDFQEDELIETL